MPSVLNKHKLAGKELPEGAVYIGRPSPWGNPFPVHKTIRPRGLAIKQYVHWVMHPDRAALRYLMRQKLKGCDLVCFCAPLPCHGDVILRIANSEDDTELSNLKKEYA